MKIKELAELLGGCEVMRVLDEEYNELVRCGVNDLPQEILQKFIKTVYTGNGMINIIALDKVKRKWYNRKGNGAK